MMFNDDEIKLGEEMMKYVKELCDLHLKNLRSSPFKTKSN